MFMQQLFYWSLLYTGLETMLLFCSMLNNLGKVQIQIQIQVWSILMFIVYAAIALLPLLRCRHCPICTPCKAQYNRGKEQMEVSKCQKLRVEIFYSVVYVPFQCSPMNFKLCDDFIGSWGQNCWVQTKSSDIWAFFVFKDPLEVGGENKSC